MLDCDNIDLSINVGNGDESLSAYLKAIAKLGRKPTLAEYAEAQKWIDGKQIRLEKKSLQEKTLYFPLIWILRVKNHRH